VLIGTFRKRISRTDTETVTTITLLLALSEDHPTFLPLPPY